MARGGPRLSRAAARSARWCAVRGAWWCAARGRRAEGLANAPGRLVPRGPLRAVQPGGPGRVRGARRAGVAGNVDQATWRIHARRLQYPSPVPTRPQGRRGPVPVTTGPPTTRPSGPGEHENQQGHQTDGEARHAHSHAQAAVMTTRVPAEQVGGRARHHENAARYDHHGADHREGNDKPHPPGRGGIGAHRSTIASRYASRKPYGQVRPSRLVLRRSPGSLRAGRVRTPRRVGDTLGP
jgi:hypothetical protein